MDREPLLLDTHDYRGRRIIFTSKKWKEKRAWHEELNLLEPKERHCYYGRYLKELYVKVVIYIRESEPYHVVSAYAIDKIKEKKYKVLHRIV
jgi:hypothetical protein